MVLTLLSVLLVSLIGVRAHSIQDSLPALVLDDEVDQTVGSPSPAPPSVPDKEKEAPKEASAPAEPMAPGNTVPLSDKPDDPKLISYETSKAYEYKPAAPTTIASAQPDAPVTRATSDSTGETSQASVNGKGSTSQSSGADLTPGAASLEPTGATNAEKDINSLLENKNDAENDLALPTTTTTTTTAAPPTTSTSPEEPKTTTRIDLDGPVDTNRSVDDRFHYMFGGSEKPAEPDAAASARPSESEPPVERPAEEKKAASKPSGDEKSGDKHGDKPDEKPGKKSDEKSDEKPPVVAESALAVVEKPQAESEAPKAVEATKGSSLDGKKIDYDDKTKSIVVESVSDDQLAKKPATTDASHRPAGAPADAPSSAPPTQADSLTEPAVKATEKPLVAEAKSQGTPVNSTVTPVAKKQPSDGKKPGSVPSILAGALGTALGAAVNPILTGKDNKTGSSTTIPPAVGSSVSSKDSTTTMTTLAGSSSTTTTKAPRKSTTDRWSRWSPSTSPSITSSTLSPAPPTRRRPILPSIRRRFRPYNRFSPFPWGGADSYTPMGADSDYVPAQEGIGFSSSRPTTTTLRPKRRGSSTESSKSSPSSTTSSPSSAAPKPSDQDNEDEAGPNVTNRRRGQGANRRRHHHHYNNRHNQNDGEFDLTGGSHRRRYNTNPGHRYYPQERDERPPFGGDSSIFNTRPYSPGFSLFNTGTSGLGSSTGSGFDLLNPFSWIDEVTKPRPPLHRPELRPPLSGGGPPTIGSPGRLPGHRPTAVEGEYSNESPQPQNHHHGHDHGHGGHRPPGGHSREDYDDYHDHHGHHGHHGHHDCHHDHDHDYDHHHHNHRPHRPHRESPIGGPLPAGGDYDTYPPSSPGYRSNRPYPGRRDQSEPFGSLPTSSGGSSGHESENPESYVPSRPNSSERSSVGPSSAGPRRIPSLFSPFDSLFGSLDEDLFGGLRSSFIDSPLRAGAETNKNTNTAFDAVVTSPKISMPSAGANNKPRQLPAAEIEKLDKENSRLVEGKILSNPDEVVDNHPTGLDQEEDQQLYQFRMGLVKQGAHNREPILVKFLRLLL